MYLRWIVAIMMMVVATAGCANQPIRGAAHVPAATTTQAAAPATPRTTGPTADSSPASAAPLVVAGRAETAPAKCKPLDSEIALSNPPITTAGSYTFQGTACVRADASIYMLLRTAKGNYKVVNPDHPIRRPQDGQPVAFSTEVTSIGQAGDKDVVVQVAWFNATDKEVRELARLAGALGAPPNVVDDHGFTFRKYNFTNSVPGE